MDWRACDAAVVLVEVVIVKVIEGTNRQIEEHWWGVSFCAETEVLVLLYNPWEGARLRWKAGKDIEKKAQLL